MHFLKKAASCSLGLTSSNYPNKTVGACDGEKNSICIKVEGEDKYA